MLDIDITPSGFNESMKNFKPDNWSVKVEHRKRDRMKIGFKLGKELSLIHISEPTRPY